MKKLYKNYNRILAGELYGFSSNYEIDVNENFEPLNDQNMQYFETEEVPEDARI